MPPKTKRRRRREPQPQSQRLGYVPIRMRSETINENERSIEGIATTEQPIRMFDPDRWEYVPEVLLGRGGEWPSDKRVVLLNAHNRHDTEDIRGSFVGLRRASGGDVRGRAVFSAAAETDWTKAKEGHLRDLSAGYQVLNKVFVPAKTTQTIGGREWTGPVNVVTKWRLREVSLTPIGADEAAKLRGYDPAAHHARGTNMNDREWLKARGIDIADLSDAQCKTLRAQLESRGDVAVLDADDSETDDERSEDDDEEADDDDEAEERAEDEDDEEEETDEEPTPRRRSKGKSKPKAKPPATKGRKRRLLSPSEFRKLIKDSVREERANERKRELAWRAEVDALCDLAGYPNAKRECYELGSVRKVQQALLAKKAKGDVDEPPPGPSFGAQREGRDRLHAGLRTAMLLRAIGEFDVLGEEETAGTTADALEQLRTKAINRVFPKSERSKDAEDFRGMSLLDMARESLIGDGYSERALRRASNQDVALAALGFARATSLGQRSGDGASIHVTSSFPALTLDALNKSMRIGYGEFPVSWRTVFSQGQPAKDFKNLHRVQVGALPNIPIWLDNDKPERLSFKDEKETYGIEAYSARIDFSWKLLVNDDMSVITSQPNRFGRSMARTINALAWSIVTGNPTMADGQAFFSTATGNRKRANLTTGAGAPSVSTLQTLTNLMLQMRGTNTPEENEGQDILGLRPKYIVGPGALMTTIEQLVFSPYDVANANMAYNTASKLTPIIEPLLDANSTTAWYLFANKRDIDTVEVTFLEGNEEPWTRDWVDEETMTRHYAVLQSAGAAAIDHRGAQKHAGA